MLNKPLSESESDNGAILYSVHVIMHNLNQREKKSVACICYVYHT